MKRYFIAIFLLVTTLFIIRISYFIIDPLRVIFFTPTDLSDKLIESSILIFVLIIITMVYKIYYKLIHTGQFLIYLWGAVILFAVINTGPYVIENYDNKQYQKMIDEASSYYQKNLSDGFTLVTLEQHSGQTFYIFKKKDSVTKMDMNYLLELIKPLNDKEDITIELISLKDNIQSTMRYTANKEFIACRDANYAASSIPNVCF
ncbi:hypothetical protein [Paenibacillus oryzisoli]|uniref:Uncharacterized protein n=1 Tax=Paenibacillus oryzisoli TaxID=1850517 RepID=A0A198ACJ3_9BACL|nr:hypothetical protein [Paenibacillus oryzisoli]OAS18668.1 hypothetical protein A8708_29050 [Paenibacillus oryzisoli]